MRILAFIALLFLSCTASAHDFYFAFAEIEYNELTQSFECSISASTHDLERLEDKIGFTIDQASEGDENAVKAAGVYIQKYFQIESNGNNVQFNFIGCEVALNGTMYFYLESEPFDLEDFTFDLKFDLLMNDFKEQQNKATVYFRNETYTHHFTQEARKNTFQLKQEETK